MKPGGSLAANHLHAALKAGEHQGSCTKAIHRGLCNPAITSINSSAALTPVGPSEISEENSRARRGRASTRMRKADG